MEYTSPVLRGYFHFRRGKNMPTMVFSFIDYDDVVIGRVRPTVVSALRGNIAEFRFSCIHVNPSFGILSSSCIYIRPFTITEVPAAGDHDAEYSSISKLNLFVSP